MNSKLNEKKLEKFEKKKNERHSTPEEILFIFEKTLEDWRPIKIYNVWIQKNPSTKITKKDVDNISNGNVRIEPNEVSKEDYEKYQTLRNAVYEKHKK